MADATGGVPPTNASPFAVPADIQAVYDHFGDAGMFSVSTIAGLPVSGNWSGRILSVDEDDSVRKWNGAGWDTIWLPEAESTVTTFGTGWSATAGFAVEVRRVGTHVWLRGTVTRASGGSGGDVLTIPAGFRKTDTADSRADGAVTSSQGHGYTLRVSGTTHKLDILYSSASGSAGEFVPLVADWFID
jgi:hypothetical protein